MVANTQGEDMIVVVGERVTSRIFGVVVGRMNGGLKKGCRRWPKKKAEGRG